MFDPLDHFGLPTDQHSRHWHWHELDLKPVDARATDADTRCRITTVEVMAAAAAVFDRRLTRQGLNAEARRSLGNLAAAIRQTVDRVREALHGVV